MKRHLLDLKIEKLEALSPLKRLTGGYSFVEDETGRPVRSVEQINEGDELTLSLRDGRVKTRVETLERVTTDE
jgi:exodeoxyribonuclease VII large subunit